MSGAGPSVVSAEAATAGGWLAWTNRIRRILLTPGLAGRVGVAEVDVVERPVGSLAEVDDVPVGPVGRPVGRLEVEDPGDVAAGIERQALDPVLGVVGEEVVAVVRGRELAAPVDEAAGDRGVPSVVRVGVDRTGVRWIGARTSSPRRRASRSSLRRRRRSPLPEPWSSRCPPRRRCRVVPVGPSYDTRNGLRRPSAQIASKLGPDAVVERVVRGHRAVRVDPQDLAARAAERLGVDPDRSARRSST